MRIEAGPKLEGGASVAQSKRTESRALVVVPPPLPAVIDEYVAPTRSEASSDRPVLLFNDQCSVCRVLSSWVKRKDAEGKDLIDERPIGDDPDALAAIHPDLDIWTTYEKIHVVMPNGELKVGGAAIAEVLKRLDATAWFSGLFDVELFGKKPFLAMLDVAYQILDKARPALGCESCGGGVVPWWAKPIEWGRKAYQAVSGR